MIRDVKYLVSQVMAAFLQRELRQNLRAFLRYLAFLGAVILAYSVLFHVLMEVEGQQHSWLTGVYWTLTVMTTLGFGDITFHSDLGRVFSILVLLTGVVLLLIVLPFAFIRYFYAPWLEAQIRLRAPRELPEDFAGHVIFCRYDPIARGLIRQLDVLRIPYVALEGDTSRALELHRDGVRVVAGEPDIVACWRAVRAEQARLVVANLSDAENANATLTLREHAPLVPVAALVEDRDAVDILELSGAQHVTPLKHRLGEQLAGRVSAGNVSAQVIGRYRDLLVAEFPVHNTPLVGRTIRDTRLRELTGVNIVGYWERGRLEPAVGDARLGDNSVAVVVGTEDQLLVLDAMFVIYQPDFNPVIVIGGGKVGRATARALRDRKLTVHVVDEDPRLGESLRQLADRVVIGDGADITVMREAGIEKAPSVVLTTHDDATNIYLAIYCRRLNPSARIICRITHDRNLEAVQRAGADFSLSESQLAVKWLLSVLQGRELLILSEEVDVFPVQVPPPLAGKTLAESGIGARTGLNAIALLRDDEVVNTPGAAARLDAGSTLLLMGTSAQREEFARLFEEARRG
jgi:Trk K+ transport system NAD-binding subunit